MNKKIFRKMWRKFKRRLKGIQKQNKKDSENSKIDFDRMKLRFDI